MKKIACLAALSGFIYFAFASSPCSASYQGPSLSKLKSKIDEVVQKQIDDQLHVGVVVGIVHDGERSIWSYGNTRLGSRKRPDADTVFEIGSASKVFTGALLGSLVDYGIVKLDDPISKYIPELNGTPVAKITLLELSTHTSGLPRMPDMQPADLRNPYKSYTWADMIAFLRVFPLSVQPKMYDDANYSNLAAGLLGEILARVSGVKYADILKARVTVPLGMKDTTITLSKDQINRFATPYNQILEETSPWDLGVFQGAGGIRSTARDMLEFVANNLSPPSNDVGRAIELSQKRWAHGKRDDVGLNWFIDKRRGDTMIWHNGQTGGFHCLIGFLKNKRIGFVVLSNTAAPVRCVSDIVSGKECELPKAFPVAASALQRYIGRYQIEPKVFMDVSVRGKLFLGQMTGRSKFKLEALSESRFNAAGGLAEITFNSDADGKVDSLTILQDGQKVNAEKM